MSYSNSGSKLTMLLFSVLSLFQINCKKNDSITDNPTVQLEPPLITNDATKVIATVTGTILDENSAPVANATVKADAVSTTTDAMGNFVFKNINISAANGFVTVIKAGYFNGIRSFVTEAGRNNYVKIQLMKKVVTGTVTNAAGGVVNTLTSASITFPANAFVTATGAAYTGTVTVYAQWIDPTAPNLPLIVPGDLRGINSSNGEYLLKSYGMVGAEFADNSGNPLKIATGKTATISFPIPTSLQATAPATIPLWHFDEATGRWKQEGSATKSGNNYSAQVNKFSFWNVDMPANFIKLDMLLKNSANSLPLANTMVKITSLTSNTYAYDYTNDSGYVSGYVPKNENLKLEVIAGTACTSNVVVHTQNIGPYTANTSLGTINVTLPANIVVNFTGTVNNCNNQPVTNGYVSLSLSNGTGTIAYTNASGVVNVSLIQCNSATTYNYTAVDLATNSYSTQGSGTVSGSTVNLGTINACGNVINTNGVYIVGVIDNNAVLWKDGVPTFLTNNPATGNKSAGGLRTVVYNNDVYVLGTEEDSTVNGWVYTIKLWKNGTVTNLTNGATIAEARGLDVYNNDVYVSGYDAINNGLSTARVWKNGVPVTLTKDTFDVASPTGVKIVNGDIYVCGSVEKYIASSGLNISRAVFWKNGVLNILPNAAFNSIAEALFLSNGDLYVAGTEAGLNQPDKAVYWKNGIKTILPLSGNNAGAVVYSIFVDNADLYIAGAVNNSGVQSSGASNAAYWKNNIINTLTSNATNQAELYDIFVKNNIVYSVGYNYQNSTTTPLYFQNNAIIPLTGFTPSQEVEAYGIFVK